MDMLINSKEQQKAIRKDERPKKIKENEEYKATDKYIIVFFIIK